MLNGRYQSRGHESCGNLKLNLVFDNNSISIMVHFSCFDYKKRFYGWNYIINGHRNEILKP